MTSERARRGSCPACDVERVNAQHCLILLVNDVEMRRGVLVIVHADDNPIESADLGHGERYLSSWPNLESGGTIV
jgi:hypothetical protein